MTLVRTKILQQSAAVALALVSSLGYWLDAQSWDEQAVWCMVAAAAGWLTAWSTSSFRSLVVVTAVALIFTLPTGLAPVPATGVVLGSMLCQHRSGHEKQ